MLLLLLLLFLLMLQIAFAVNMDSIIGLLTPWVAPNFDVIHKLNKALYAGPF